MGIVGDFTVPADSFALPTALTDVPRVSVEADRLASHSTMEVLPFLWATDGDLDGFHQALEDDPTVDSVSIAEETDQTVLFRIDWADSIKDLVDEMVDHHATITEAAARDGEWHLRLRFSEEEMVSEFQEHFQKTDREFEVERLHHPSQPRQRAFGLTEEQHEALVTAVSEGYFSIPRESSAEDVGDALDISANAASQRIRRGSETLIRSGLTITDDTE